MRAFDWLDDDDDGALDFDAATPIETASPGPVTIAGTLRELDPPLDAPSDAQPCLWYLAVAESLPLDALAQPTRGMCLSRRVGVRCLIDDGKSLAIVDLSGARFGGSMRTYDLGALGPPALDWVGDLREEAGHPRFTVDAVALHELRVGVGDEVVIEGRGAWSTSEVAALAAGGIGGGYRSAPRVLVVTEVGRANRRGRG